MARTRKTSPLDDMLDLVSLLPWWAGVAVAVVGYVVLHRMAAPVPVTAIQPGQITGIAVQSMITALATVGQYFVPLIGLIGAGMSLVVQHSFCNFPDQ
jgi:restriction system protein